MENNISLNETAAVASQVRTFQEDVLMGLNSSPKFLSAKYFYDAAGDKLFQDIMDSEEYYPTKSELEIFSKQTGELASSVAAGGDDFELIELGAGDATKSIFLLKELMSRGVQFTYIPIDISENIIDYLNLTLPLTVPGMRVNAMNGDYFEMLRKVSQKSAKRKVVLFLGANIGNMSIEKAGQFCVELRSNLGIGDMAIIGIDLKKNPKTILAAYNDTAGYTRMFNLNLLSRINRELNANFDLNTFEHFPSYDPSTGSCKSYLISLQNQKVMIGNHPVFFEKDEFIYMEISQKYSVIDAEQLITEAGFSPEKIFFDTKKWFIDIACVAV